MAYERQSFKNGQVLKAEHLKCIEDCLCDMSPVADSFKFSTDCVGKMIRVAAVDENGKPTKWETLDAAADASGSDVLLIDEDVEFISRGATIPRLPEAEFLPGQESDLVEGATYIVTWNGVEYECVAKRNGYDECFIGNEYLGDEVNDTGEPFYIDSTSAVSYHIFKVTSDAETISIKVIQRKKGYLPDGVPYVQTAAVGQTVVVSEVDANGKPTKWKAVSLSASDIGARPDTWTPTAGDVGADPAGTASGAVSEHNVSDTAHNDIRELINGLTTRLNALANSDDTTLDQMAELVAYIKANRGLIDSITTGKVSVSDIVDNLTTNVKNKPLSAAQGVALKGLIDKLSSGKLDMTAVADWAKAASKPSYKASEVGADPSGTAASAVSDHNKNDEAHQDIRKQIGQLSNEKVDQAALTLGYHTDGMIYIFAGTTPLGTGLELSAGGDVVGFVDSANNIVVKGNLADGTYSVKYEMEDGSTIDIGNLVLDSNVYYSVTKNLTQCTISNSATQVIQGESYSATITAKRGYVLKSVTVTMGGSPVSVSGGVINIANVTGNIVITAVAEEIKAEYTNIANANSTNKTDWEQWINDARIGSDGNYRLESGTSVSGWILLKAGQTVYWQGLNTTDSVDSNGSGVYTTSKVLTSVATMANQTAEFSNISVTANGGQATAKKDLYLRLVCKTPTDMSAVIITIDEPIV